MGSPSSDLELVPLQRHHTDGTPLLPKWSTLTSKGQITMPKAIRDLLRLGPGDRVDFVVKDDGTVVVRPAAVDVRELRGFLHRKGMKPLSIDKMNAIVRLRGAGG